MLEKSSFKIFVLFLYHNQIVGYISHASFMRCGFGKNIVLLVLVSLNTVELHGKQIFVDDGFTDSHKFALELRVIVINLTNILVHLIQLDFHIFCIEIGILINQSGMYNVII